MDVKKMTVRIQCPKCNGMILTKMETSIVDEIVKSNGFFPFPVIVMHTILEPHKEIHTLVAYIDKNFKCRHAEFLSGSRVFITPYIVYNPSLLQMYCIEKYQM